MPATTVADRQNVVPAPTHLSEGVGCREVVGAVGATFLIFKHHCGIIFLSKVCLAMAQIAARTVVKTGAAGSGAGAWGVVHGASEGGGALMDTKGDP